MAFLLELTGAAFDYMHSVVADLKNVAIREVTIEKQEEI